MAYIPGLLFIIDFLSLRCRPGLLDRLLPFTNLLRNRQIIGEKRPFRIHTGRAFNKNSLARHQVAS